MLVNYKVRAIKYSTYEYDGETYQLLQDYWTTVKLEEGLNDFWVKYYAKPNLMKQVCMFMKGNCRSWITVI